MQLNFTKAGNAYVAEFKVESDFNLHIERSERGFMFVNQRTTASGQYDSIKGTSFNNGDTVVDFDFTGVLYPKYIQVVSKVEPTYAEVTSNGEVVQIGGTKKVEIDVNGITKEYEYEEGMTWADWVESKYSNDEFVIGSGSLFTSNGDSVYYENQEIVTPWDIIDGSLKYHTASQSPL